MGSVVEEGFWIDKIKSHCFVTVSIHKLNVLHYVEDLVIHNSPTKTGLLNIAILSDPELLSAVFLFRN